MRVLTKPTKEQVLEHLPERPLLVFWDRMLLQVDAAQYNAGSGNWYIPGVEAESSLESLQDEGPWLALFYGRI